MFAWRNSELIKIEMHDYVMYFVLDSICKEGEVTDVIFLAYCF